MSEPAREGDLYILVADKNMEFSLRGLLSRPEALGIRPLRYEISPHPERDPGCFLRAPDLLRLYQDRFDRALVLLDHHGSGQEDQAREKLEADLEERLGQVGWQGRSAAIVIDPELEAWVWSDSPHVESALGWGGRRPDLKTWLREEGHLLEGESKPGRPKEVVEKALWTARKPRSSSIYQRLAERVSFQRCEDAAFRKLLRLLREWFPADPGA